MATPGQRTQEVRYSYGDKSGSFILELGPNESVILDADRFSREVGWQIQEAENIYPLRNGAVVTNFIPLGDEPRHPLLVEVYREPEDRWIPYSGGPWEYIDFSDGPKLPTRFR